MHKGDTSESLSSSDETSSLQTETESSEIGGGVNIYVKPLDEPSQSEMKND